jgi:hypothetical protein
MLRIPHCLDNKLTDGGKVVSLTRAALYSPETFFYFWYSFLLATEFLNDVRFESVASNDFSERLSGCQDSILSHAMSSSAPHVITSLICG